MAKRVFLSFSFTADKGPLNDLLQFFQFKGGPVEATPAFMTEDLSAFGEEHIKAAIRQQMTGCVALLVLVGDEAHNSRWIQYEAGVANELGIPKYGMRHPARRGGFPNAHVGMKEIAWSGTELAKVVSGL
jgi:hypothetical protein